MSTRSQARKKKSPRKKAVNKQSNNNDEIEEEKVEKENRSNSNKKIRENAFGDELLCILYENKRSNIILSPLSILIGLTICMNGSNKNTLKEITNVIYPHRKNKQLTFTNVTNITNKTMNICKYFNQKYNGSNSKPLIKIINKLYLQQKFKVLPKYSRAVESDNIESINFNKNTAKIINEWCKKNTHHKIKKIVSDEMMLSNVQLLIVNAIYFKGNLVNKFGRNNTKQSVSFYYNNKRKIEKCKIEMMHSVKAQYFKQGIDNIYDVVKLQYKHSDLSLILVIDNHSANSNQILCFKSYHFSSLKFGSKKKLDLFVPKFKYDFWTQLNKELSEMGIHDAFDRSADFSNMAQDGFFVHLSFVIHRASMEVNEEGTEDIAARGKGTRIRFDHPFTFYIYDGKKEIVLFSGVYAGK